MAEMTRVALDAMGGDNAPVEMVKGAVDAVNKEQNVTVLLVGIEEIVREDLMIKNEFRWLVQPKLSRRQNPR